MARTGFVCREEFLLHDTGPHHPERPARIAAIESAIDRAELGLVPLDAEPASREDILRVHTAGHMDAVRACCANGDDYPDPDTIMGRSSWSAALLAAGAGIAAAKAVLDRSVDNAFCAVRPPGHHAETDRAMGFCLFNNIAITARWLQRVAGVERIAILDWDVHHGNGTQNSFYDDASVCYVSLHQHPHYPGTGLSHERGAHGNVRNLPMPWNAPADAWLDAVESEAAPAIERFDPDMLLISAGFDAHQRDPLGAQTLQTSDFAEMTRRVRNLAGGRVVSILEGGYHLDSLAASVVAHVRVLTGQAM